MPYVANFKGDEYQLVVEEAESGMYRVRINDEEYEVDFFNASENIFSLIIDHESYEVDVDEVGNDTFTVMVDDAHFDVQVVDAKKKRLAEKLAGAGALQRQDIKSPMAGNIWRILKNQDETVETGEVLIILEAMKMENEIRSPISGTITGMAVAEGDAVSAGAILCQVTPMEGE